MAYLLNSMDASEPHDHMQKQYDLSMTLDVVRANASLALLGETVTGLVVVTDAAAPDIATRDNVPTGVVEHAGDMVSPGLIELLADTMECHIQTRRKVDRPDDAAVLAHDAERACTGPSTFSMRCARKRLWYAGSGQRGIGLCEVLTVGICHRITLA
jgi:hypothetical protein